MDNADTVYEPDVMVRCGISVRHYQVITTGNPAIIHHGRDDTGAITTAILRDGAVQLAPPGLALSGIFNGL